MNNETLLLLVLIVLVLGSFPVWPYANSWGYGPSGVLTLLLVVFLVWAISNERPLFKSSVHSSSASQDVKDTTNDIGHDVKRVGRDVADSIRNTLQ
jgi:hypothetical protein